MTVYSFRVTLERFPDVSRDIDLDGRHTLHDLHHAIQFAYDWDDDHLYAFHMDGDKDDDRHEYVCPRTKHEPLVFSPSAPPNRAADTRLCLLGLRPGTIFLYIFDYGDMWRHWISVLNIDTNRELKGAEIVGHQGAIGFKIRTDRGMDRDAERNVKWIRKNFSTTKNISMWTRKVTSKFRQSSNPTFDPPEKSEGTIRVLAVPGRNTKNAAAQ